MKTALDAEMQALLTESQRFAAPLDSDRQRITEALRARLGAAVVDPGNTAIDRFTSGSGGLRHGGTENAVARTLLSGGGWLKLVIATGIVSGALGFALGYQLKGSEPAPPSVQAPTPSEASPSVPELPPLQRGAAAPAPVDATLDMGGALATHGVASGTANSLDGHAMSTGPAPATPNARAAAVDQQPRAVRVPPRAARARPARPSVAPASDGAEAAWSFSEVIERLRRANLALGRGQASLALMLLAEIDRHAGATLREERDVTRVLTLCALGEEAAARQIAEPLLAGGSGSIYTRRLEQSCAAPARP